MIKCARHGCKKERKDGSDLCAEHTRKYYERWTRCPPRPSYGCGGGNRTPRVVGEGSFGHTLGGQHKAGEDNGD
jgi:hypothetical protein